MAKSPSHKFGQIVGNLLEEITLPVLQKFCDSRGLYLDKQGQRGDARRGHKVTWDDRYGNAHDLDFVIEKGGTPDEKGIPVAFIEAAWRRYTKHSKNKVQEMQGAVLPIVEVYALDKPFIGAVIAGEFTAPSISQLESVGFKVLYIHYQSIISAFKEIGINAEFDEDTPDDDFLACVNQIDALPKEEWERLKHFLTEDNHQSIGAFFVQLQETLDRVINFIAVIPLYGTETQFTTVSDAVKFLEDSIKEENRGELRKFEVVVKYSNGDAIDASFSTKRKTIDFLKQINA